MQYPDLQRAADQASDSNQRTFLALNFSQLALLAVSAFVAGVDLPTPADRRQVAAVVALMLAGALALGIILQAVRFDERWFRCRAFAENLKSRVWFFVVAPPGSQSESDYLKEVEEVRQRLRQVEVEIAKFGRVGELITPGMRAAQRLPLQEKIELFRRERAADQIQWYRRKSKYNKRKELRWSILIMGLEFFASIYAGLQVWEVWEFNAVGGIAALGSAFIAWTQIRRFSDLSTSYGIAAADLEQICAQYAGALDEQRLKEFVQQLEVAVAREWLAASINFPSR